MGGSVCIVGEEIICKSAAHGSHKVRPAKVHGLELEKVPP